MSIKVRDNVIIHVLPFLHGHYIHGFSGLLKQISHILICIYLFEAVHIETQNTDSHLVLITLTDVFKLKSDFLWDFYHYKIIKNGYI